MRRWLPAALACASLWAGPYQAQIRRTSYGVAHIEAKDWGSLAFGDGYAQAEDHLCTIADQVVKVRGERARYFGAGPKEEFLNSDVTARALRLADDGAALLERQPAQVRDWYAGWAAGYNEYLARTGKDHVGGWCRGAEWVTPITTRDVVGYARQLALVSTQFAPMIATAQPPDGKTAARRAEADPPPVEIGLSNGWAIGKDRAESGRGMLVANPHYPWVGSNRFWEKHHRIPGVIDAYGVGLIGMPDIAIGFNDSVAWTHTVSAGKRIVLYRLDLVPGRPTAYKYGDSVRAMTSRTVTVAVKQPGGSISMVKRDVWFSHYGPVVNYPKIGWTTTQVLAAHDANQENDGPFSQHLAMAQARNLKEFQDAHAKYQGTMWVNTIAATREGAAWYADASATPNLSAQAIAEWLKRRESDGLTKSLWQQGGTVLLDGSDPLFELRNDAGARTPGNVGWENMPKIERTDYVFNANDSFWLANSHALLEGAYSPLHGEQRTPRSLRTRNNDLTLSGLSPDRPAGANGKFSLDEMAAAILSNRALGGELLRDELVRRCRTQPDITVNGAAVDLKPACDALAAWDLRNDLDSRGAVLFREFMGNYEPPELLNRGRLWAVGFDPASPVTTPNTLAAGQLALENLARAALLLRSRGLAPDVRLGDVQYADKAGRRMPVHGGDGFYDGVMNMQRNSVNTTTLEPMNSPAAVKGSRFLTEQGYPVVHGSSFLMALEYRDDGPHAKAFLTYGQSGDPASEHFTDQTLLFAAKKWRPILFRAADIAADVKRDYRVTGKR